MSIALDLDRIAEPGMHQEHAETGPRLSVLLATRYGRLGASSRLRLLQYAAPLARYGIDCTARPFLSDAYVRALYQRRSRIPAVLSAYARAAGLRAAVQAHDIVWIEKEMLPFLPAIFERAVLRGGKTYVLDFDDAWFLRYGDHGNRLARALLGGKFPALLRGAALTVVANETLRDWAVGAGARNVLLLPTVVDLDHYPMLPEPAGQPFTVCWIGTPVTAPYLARLADPLRVLAAEAPLELLVIGAPDFAIEGVACRTLPWNEATEASLIGQCHAGIMPLPDDAWARGKSGYKLIQYMAAGRPTVGSPVGANTTIVRDGVTGFLAADPADWADRLRRLRDDAALRRAMGEAARARVAEHYALQGAAPRLAAAIRAVAVS
ncbi:MAG: glycosyltransferase [Acidiphilium sp.]